MTKALLIIVGGVLSTLGVYGFQHSTRSFFKAWKLKSSSVKPIIDIDPDDGLVEIEGTAKPADNDTIYADIVGDDAVLVLTTVERRQERRNSAWDSHQQRRTWKTLDRNIESVPFHVEDRTGTARVDVPDIDESYKQFGPHINANTATLTLEESRMGTTGRPQPLDIADGFEVDFDSDTRYRFRQGAVTVDGDVYVAGQARRAVDDVSADIKLSGDDNPADMVIGDKQEAVEQGSVGGAIFGMFLTLLCAGFGALLLTAGLNLV